MEAHIIGSRMNMRENGNARLFNFNKIQNKIQNR